MNSATMRALTLTQAGGQSFINGVSVRDCPLTEGPGKRWWISGWYNAARARNIVTKANCSTEHLCTTCICEYPECDPETETMEFGDGMGGDNVIACGTYVPRKGQK